MSQLQAEVHVLRVDSLGRVIGAAPPSAWLEDSQTKLCRNVVAARDVSRRCICDDQCPRQNGSTGAPLVFPQAVVRKRLARLICQPLLDEMVVVVEFKEPTNSELSEPLQLTLRERQVLQLVAQGLTTAKIAERLGVSNSTARTHIENARQRLGAHTRAEALSKALDHHLL